jgi:hypothetical protein
MSQSNIYGFAPNEIKPGPDFAAGSDSAGKWTGSQTFTCRKFDFSSSVIQGKLKKGTPITDLYPQLSSEWSFLYVTAFRHEHQPGGITKIFVDLEGSSEDSPEPDSAESTDMYSMSATLTERDILKHPYFSDLSQYEIDAITSLLRGTGRRKNYDDPASIVVVEIQPYYEHSALTSAKALKLYDLLINKGQTTYPAPSIEWTVQKTDKIGIPDADLDGLGYIAAAPEGNPPVVTGRNWMFTAATQSRAKESVKSVKTWTKTYTLSPPGELWDEMFNQP